METHFQRTSLLTFRPSLSRIWKQKSHNGIGNDVAAERLAALTEAHPLKALSGEKLSSDNITIPGFDRITAPAMSFPLPSQYSLPAEPSMKLPFVAAATTDEKSEDERLEERTAKFTLFPELPIEIRLQVFRAMFPRPRHVCLDADFPWTFNYETPVQSQNRLPLPPTLFINQESRAETLKHYYVLFKQDSTAFKSYEPFAERPFVFNPTIDSVYITFGSLHGGTKYRRFDAWMEYLNTQLPGGTNAVQSLEIRDMNWVASITTWIQGESPMENLTRWNKPGGLRWFHGLRELCFTEHRNADNGLRYRGAYRLNQPTPAGSFVGHAAQVTDWFMKSSEKSVERRIPHVTVRGFHKVRWNALNMG